MIYFSGGHFKVAIAQNVINRIKEFRQLDANSNESGGILLGQVKDDYLYVLKVSEPSKLDKSSRFSFERNAQEAQKVINKEFTKSGKKTIYLGEWHTHPEDYPKPSSADLIMICDQYNKNELNEDLVLMFIQGNKGVYFSVFDGTRFVQLHEDIST